MSSDTEEAPLTARVSQRPALDLAQLKRVRLRDLGFRFLAGAVTSVVAGVISATVTARVGGFFLAFPAILAASLTLVEEQEDSAQAREDCRGATVGALAMAVFAVVVALAVEHVNGAVTLALAAAAWLGVALLVYRICWFRRS